MGSVNREKIFGEGTEGREKREFIGRYQWEYIEGEGTEETQIED